MYHYIAVTGHNTAWSVMFYIFSFAKCALMAIVTLLVGAGWSVLKPFLNDREKRILIIALALQVRCARVRLCMCASQATLTAPPPLSRSSSRAPPSS